MLMYEYKCDECGRTEKKLQFVEERERLSVCGVECPGTMNLVAPAVMSYVEMTCDSPSWSVTLPDTGNSEGKDN